MTEAVLTTERILQAAEDVLRRFGPAKATVVDVARALGVSHGSVYRHFPSKAALREAVVERWLARISTPLAAIAESDMPPPERLETWLRRLVALKRAKVGDDPEFFAAYQALAAEAGPSIEAHIDALIAQLAHIIADGIAAGVFAPGDPAVTARAVLDATARFHNPTNAAAWTDPRIDAASEAVLALVFAGLAPPAKP